MKILVRLPNWLGDMVMSVGLMQQLPLSFPNATISVIVKKGLEDLLDFFPPLEHRFIFNKQEYKGIKGAWSFGRQINKQEKFDLFICLPDSLSSAVMARATGAKQRIGFRKEGRGILLTHAYTRPKNLHRALEYVRLLELKTNRQSASIQVRLHHNFIKKDYVVVNINSEASSRRLTVEKAVEIINTLRKEITTPIKLIGAPKEKEFVSDVMDRLDNKDDIHNLAGATSLHQLAEVLASARCMLTTDSGPGHLANALGTSTISLFGAGNEKNTAPFHQEKSIVIRLGQLPCEPCEKNICKLYPTPQCLDRLYTFSIVDTVKKFNQY